MGSCVISPYRYFVFFLGNGTESRERNYYIECGYMNIGLMLVIMRVADICACALLRTLWFKTEQCVASCGKP